MLPRVRSSRGTSQDWYSASGAERFRIGPVQANAWIEQVEERHLPPRSSAAERQRFRKRLHLADLMLARTCALGEEAAWEELWRRCQPRLRAAARTLTHNAERADELADNLLTDLYAPQEGDGRHRSKLFAYSGLGSLDAWLCTLLAQAHVNAWRRERRQVALEDCAGLQALLVAPHSGWPASSPAARNAVDVALARVLRAAAAPARLLLCLYFLDSRTLAEIAAVLRVHESTVSRRLDRVLRQLRRQMRRELAGLGLRPAAAEAALHIDPRWLQIDVSRSLRAQPQEGPRVL
ncbi:MAG: sigma-70 family RNA polymerase sigma factor [Acidobacteria bacterium]|nr:MAG: sigma-70 family RNA polymerase sigma factor [Acidobacteriota bacterium]